MSDSSTSPFRRDGEDEEASRKRWAEAISNLDDNISEVFDNITERVHAYKDYIISNGPADLDPVIFALPMTYDAQAVMVQLMISAPATSSPEDDARYIVEAMGTSINMIRGDMGRPLVVGFVSEIWYSKRAKELGTWPSNEPDRQEAVCVRCYWRAGAEVHDGVRFMPYHYGDGGVVWEEAVDERPAQDHGFGEHIDGVLRNAFTRENN